MTLLRQTACLALLLLAGAPLAGSEGTLLHNGWRIQPLGKLVEVGNLPLALLPLPGGRLAVLECGFGPQGVRILDAEGQTVARRSLARTWLGMAADQSRGLLYISGGGNHEVEVLDMTSLKRKRTIPARAGASRGYIGALALARDGTLLLAAQLLGNRISLIDLPAGRLREVAVGDHPYAIAVSRDSRRAFVSNWGSASVSEIDLRRSAVVRVVAVGTNPNALALDDARRRLYVACANADAVDVVDTTNGRVLYRIRTRLDPRDPPGASPDALALAPTGRRLFVANADNNDVAVIDVAGPRPRVQGFLPTGWYPTALALLPEGRLAVANGKGTSAGPNPQGPQANRPGGAEASPRYIGRILRGSVEIVHVPQRAALARATGTVRANRPAAPENLAPPPDLRGKIRHVIYIIKENRTYDQVLGDDPRGDGDPSLLFFGENSAPNHHALAREFVLYDRFFVDADVSADGHNWSTAAIADDFVQKTWPSNYSHRGMPYAYEGDDETAEPASGRLWDDALRAAATYRSYGEFVDYQPNANVPHKALRPALEGHIDPFYRGFDIAYRDVDRVSEWLREFRQFEASGDLPALEVVRLPSDHTAALRPGCRSPRAMMADNDLALGRLVEAVTRSRDFQSTAIFILEDDAQDGPDHVDAHRSILLVISPFTPRHTVDHNRYTTSSVLRTIEALLGFAPMTQYDERATLLARAFSGPPDLAPYQARVPEASLEEENPLKGPDATASALMPLDREDEAPMEQFNAILWRYAKGPNTPLPPPVIGYEDGDK